MDDFRLSFQINSLELIAHLHCILKLHDAKSWMYLILPVSLDYFRHDTIVCLYESFIPFHVCFVIHPLIVGKVYLIPMKMYWFVIHPPRLGKMSPTPMNM